MDLFNLAKIVEVSPLIALTLVFSYVIYKIGIGYMNFVNKILEKYSGDVQSLRDKIQAYQNENREKHENIISKIDNFRTVTTQELNSLNNEDEQGHNKVLQKIDELRLEIVRSGSKGNNKGD